MQMRFSWLVLVPGALALVGCGGNDTAEVPLNHSLGETYHGAPIGKGTGVDRGVLQDQKSYKPAKFEPLAGAAPSAGPGAAGPEAQAVRDMARRVLDGLVALDPDSVLDEFVPSQVAALQADTSMMYEAIQAGRLFYKVVEDKAPELSQAPGAPSMDEVMPRIVEAVMSAVQVEVLGEDTAGIGFDSEALQTNLQPIIDEVMAAATAQMEAGGDDAATMPVGMPGGGSPLEMMQGMFADPQGGGMADEQVPVRRVDGEWKIDIQHTFTEEQAVLVAQGFEIVKDLFGSAIEKVEAAEGLDQQTLNGIMQQTTMEMMPRMMGWFGQLQMTMTQPDDEGP